MVAAMSTNFGLIGFAVSEIVQFLNFYVLARICLFTSTFREFGAYFLQMTSPIILPQKVPLCAETRRLSHKLWISVRRYDLCAWSRKNGQNSQKSHKSDFSPSWENPHPTDLPQKLRGGCRPRHPRVQILGLKFSGVIILQGVEFSVFLLILAWALQQCSAIVLPVM